MFSNNNHIYFDYAATTPVDNRVFDAMKPFLYRKKNLFGNPNSIHWFGQNAYNALEDARSIISKAIYSEKDELIFTGSATESNNYILRGIVNGFLKNNKNIKPHIIISNVEHSSIFNTAIDLENKNLAEITYLKVFDNGIIDLNKLKNSIKNNTILVSIMFVNNETGVIQPIHEISEFIKSIRKSRIYPILHTDAVQAFSLYDLNVSALGVDAMTISSHKIYGPKGVGGLYVSKNITKNNLLDILITGGGQENGIRSGTQNVAGIVGFAKAVEICTKEREFEYERINKLSKYLIKKLSENIKNIKFNGDLDNKSPHIINVMIPYNGENISTALNNNNIAVSMGSACSQRMVKISRVLYNMGYDEERIRQSIRISIGRFTTKNEIDILVNKIIILLGDKKIKDDFCTD